MIRTGADLVVEALSAAGVRHLFTLSGNQILSIYDAAIGRDIQLIHTRHEAAAVHMADGWGRLTESPGVALVTAGPGHLNSLSALYYARMAESPVVLLSGHSPLSQLGRGAFQELDQAAAAGPVAKAAWVAKDADKLGEDIARALALACEGRPGPVHVSLPSDLLESTVRTGIARTPATEPDRDPGEETLRSVLERLAEARRPLILAGPAMGRAARWVHVQRLAAVTGVPALLMESPRGINDPMLHGARECLRRADLVLLLGKKPDFSLQFGQPAAFAEDCRFVQIDPEREQLRSGPRILLSCRGNPATAVPRLTALAATRDPGSRPWRDEVLAAAAARPSEWAVLRRSSHSPVHPLRVCAAVQPYIDDGAVLVCDGGEFGQWAQAGLEAGTRLINGLSGGIGSAIPLALASRLARPEKHAIAALGDGTFGFHALEFDTAVRYGLPLVAVVGNDARWNAEHQLQVQHYGESRAVACDLLLSRYDRLVEALGGHGEYVERPEDLEPALSRAFSSELPACVNVRIDGVPAPVPQMGRGAH